jgi:hypothetical protein
MNILIQHSYNILNIIYVSKIFICNHFSIIHFFQNPTMNDPNYIITIVVTMKKL